MSPRTSLVPPFLFCLLVLTSATSLVAQIDPVGEIILNPSAGSFWGVAEKDGYVYVVTNGGDFAVVDARSLSIDGPFTTRNSTVLRQSPGSTYGLLRYGNTLYLYGGGIQVYDITNPASPVAGVHLTDYGFRNLVRSGDYLFGTGRNNVVVYSIADPSNPSLRASATLDDRTGYAIAYRDNYVYVGELKTSDPPYYGLRVFSYDGANTLTSVFQKATTDVPYHLFVNGSYLADTGTGGVRVWSLADPARPVVVDEEAGGGRAAVRWGDLIVMNGRVYKWHGPLLEQLQAFTPGGSQHDGVPHGAAANSKFIFICQQLRVLVLTTPPTVVFPQYANGLTGDTRNRTRLVLRNTGTTTATGSARFRDADGAPNLVSIGGQSKAEVQYSIPAGGTFQLVTDGTGTLRSGPLEIRSDLIGDSQVRGTEIFELLGHSASVQEAPLSKTHSAFVSRSTSENTGVAMYNPSLAIGSLVEARLVDKNGTLVAGPVTVVLAARHQMAIFVDNASLFQSYFAGVSGAFEGTLKLSVTNGGPISVIGLIQTVNGSLLVVPVESSGVGP